MAKLCAVSVSGIRRGTVRNDLWVGGTSSLGSLHRRRGCRLRSRSRDFRPEACENGVRGALTRVPCAAVRERRGHGGRGRRRTVRGRVPSNERQRPASFAGRLPRLVYRPSKRSDSYLVDPASSHMLVSKIKPCMSKYKQVCTVKLRMAH